MKKNEIGRFGFGFLQDFVTLYEIMLANSWTIRDIKIDIAKGPYPRPEHLPSAEYEVVTDRAIRKSSKEKASIKQPRFKKESSVKDFIVIGICPECNGKLLPDNLCPISDKERIANKYSKELFCYDCNWSLVI